MTWDSTMFGLRLGTALVFGVAFVFGARALTPATLPDLPPTAECPPPPPPSCDCEDYRDPVTGKPTHDAP